MKNRFGWVLWAALGIIFNEAYALDMVFTEAQTVSTNILLSEDTTVTVNAGATAVVSFTGELSGEGKLTKAGAARVQLSNVNTYSGGTDIESGRVIVKGNSALGTGVVKVLSNSAQLATAGGAAATVANDIEVYATGQVTLPVISPLTLSGHLKTMSESVLYYKAGDQALIFKGGVDAVEGAAVQFDITVGDINFEAGANVVLTNNTTQPTVSFMRVESTSPATYKRKMVVDEGASVTMNGIALGGKNANVNTPLSTVEVKGGSLNLTGYSNGTEKVVLFVESGLTNVIRVSGGTVTAADGTVWCMNNAGSSNTLMEISGGVVSLSQVSLGNRVLSGGFDPSKIDVVVSGGVLEARHKWLWLNQLNPRLCNTLTVNGGTVKFPQTSSGYNEYLVVPCQTRMTLNGGTFVALASSWGDYLTNVKQLYLGASGGRIDTGTNIVKMGAARFTALNGAETAGIVKVGTGNLWLTLLPATDGMIDVQEGTLTLQEDSATRVMRRVPNDPMYLYSFETEIVTDLTRNTYHATLMNNDSNVTQVAHAGLDGHQAISLDGTKGLAVAHTNYTEEISEWTLSAWVRQAADTASDDANTFLSSCYNNEAEANTFYARINADRTFTLCHAGASDGTEDDVTLTTTAIAPLGSWSLLTVKADGLNGLSLYVNGVKQTMTVNVNGSPATTNVYGTGQPWYLVAAGRVTTNASPALLIGKKLDASTTCFSGDMDDVTLYKRALSESEIALLHKRANPYASRVYVAAGATLDLADDNLSLGTVMGEGIVNNGTLTVTETLAPGATNSEAGALLSITDDLTLGTNVLYACDWSSEANDLVAVGGTLTVASAGVIDLGLDAENTALRNSSRRSFTIFTYGSITGAENFSNWTVTGLGKGPVASASVTAADGVVRVRVTFSDGTLISVL